MKRVVRNAEVEEKWRKKANNREQWKNIERVTYDRSDTYKRESRVSTSRDSIHRRNSDHGCSTNPEYSTVGHTN